MLVPTVIAILEGAIQEAESMLQNMRTVKSTGESALNTSNYVRQTSIDPVGVPAMSAALEEIDKTIAHLTNYIEQVRTYIATIR